MLLLGHVKRRLQKVMVGESGVYGLIILISKKRNGLFQGGFCEVLEALSINGNGI